jgi:hypothetical protein
MEVNLTFVFHLFSDLERVVEHGCGGSLHNIGVSALERYITEGDKGHAGVLSHH